jgi:hypothetical protein
VCRRPAPLEQTYRAADQSARANREDAQRAGCLALHPIQYRVIIHHGFLPEAARYMQNIELARVGQGGIRLEPQTARIPHRLCRLCEYAIGGIWQTRQDLERTRQVDLIQAFEQERADLDMPVERNHARVACRRQKQ